MPWADFCMSKAEECELLARETAEPGWVREWLMMAADWRAAASANDDETSEDQELGS